MTADESKCESCFAGCDFKDREGDREEAAEIMNDMDDLDVKREGS